MCFIEYIKKLLFGEQDDKDNKEVVITIHPSVDGDIEFDDVYWLFPVDPQSWDDR